MNLRQPLKSGTAAFLGSLAWSQLPIVPSSARQRRALRLLKDDPSVLQRAAWSKALRIKSRPGAAAISGPENAPKPTSSTSATAITPLRPSQSESAPSGRFVGVQGLDTPTVMAAELLAEGLSYGV
jgi:hypothetical protein